MIETIFWDFDGVIIQSDEIRERGFRLVLKKYSSDIIEDLIEFHRKNGGLSRYVKFRYFYEELLGCAVSDAVVNSLSNDFKKIMLSELKNPNLLRSTVDFIKQESSNMSMHVVSGSDQIELRELCDYFGLNDYFVSIMGSPTSKTLLVRNLIDRHDYDISKCVLIGDSINDFEAARDNEIHFYGINCDTELRKKSTLNFKEVFDVDLK